MTKRGHDRRRRRKRGVPVLARETERTRTVIVTERTGTKKRMAETGIGTKTGTPGDPGGQDLQVTRKKGNPIMTLN